MGNREVVAAGTDGAVTEMSVRAQLQRILRSTAFSSAPGLTRLLEYLVAQSLAGNAGQIKQYSIAIEVFGRAQNFDPGIDTIVRVQARRLRARLHRYYLTEGRFDPVLITIPTGRYFVGFELVSPANSAQPANAAPSFASPGSQGAEAPGRIARAPSPLPEPRTPLLGREQDTDALITRLTSSAVRLVTVTGAGGSGKTRLALNAANKLIPQFSGGVYFASLAGLSDATMLDSTIAQLFGVMHTGGKPLVEALQTFFSTCVQHPILLLLDNFEHILSGAAFVTKLLDACPLLRILVTSRAPLHVYGEHEYPVLPLALPDIGRLPALEDLSLNPAVQLILQRANAVNPVFVLNQENARPLAEICCRLDGLPLAIELAAPRLKILCPAVVLDLLRNRLGLLTGGPCDMPARQQTLRSTIDWSYELLSEVEQRLFRRLSVFAGGCTLEAAEAVCNTRRDLGVDVVDGITSLADKSLLHEMRIAEAAVRFGMLETVREYALERLTESGELEQTKKAHNAFCLVLAEEGNQRLTPLQRFDWLAACEAEHDNLRAALDCLLASVNVEWAFRMGAALFTFWHRKEYLAEGRERLVAILRLGEEQERKKERARLTDYCGTFAANEGDYHAAISLFVKALRIYRELGDQRGAISQLNNLGVNTGFLGDYSAARDWYEQALAACRELADAPEIAAVLSNLAKITNAMGDHSMARSQFEEALSIFRQLNDRDGIGWSLSQLGDLAHSQLDLSEAHRLYQESVDVFRAIDDKWGLARSFSDLGYLACDRNDAGAAHAAFEQALTLFRELGHQRGVAKALEGFAYLAALQKKRERALTLAGAAATVRGLVGVPQRPNEQMKLENALDNAWRNTPSTAAWAAWKTGQSWTLEQAITYAVHQADLVQTKATGS